MIAGLAAVVLIVACSSEDPTASPTSIAPNMDLVDGSESSIITTYYWEDGDWVEHAWWNASFLEPDLFVQFFAWNWEPGYPAFWATFDNFYAYDGIAWSDHFNSELIGPIWHQTGSNCSDWGQGALACAGGGVITVDIQQGPAPGGLGRTAGVSSWDMLLHGEFDVQIDFALSSGFHDAPNAHATLSVIDDRTYNASLQLRGGRYEAIERGGWQGYYRPMGVTRTDDSHGKLRITRTRVEDGGRVVESVSGSGSLPAVEQEGDWRTFSFTARRHADGTVDGQWERIRRQDGNAADTKSHGVVTCFNIVGDEVWLGGYATSGVRSEPPNNGVAWRVKDNSQGKRANPDQISLQWFGIGPEDPFWHCANKYESLELYDIEAGDIKIHRK
jgi:hypothetical protein